MVAVLSPITYLKLHSVIGFGPIPLPWVISQAHEGLIVRTADYCREPVLLSWHRSFGGGPVVPDGIQIPLSEAFSELVLINSGIIYVRTKLVLDAMAMFNVELLSQCFGYLES
jgi:hypothetical protein